MKLTNQGGKMNPKNYFILTKIYCTISKASSPTTGTFSPKASIFNLLLNSATTT